MRALRWLGSAVALVVVVLLTTSACSTLPSLEDRSVSHAFRDTGDTRLGQLIEPQVREHPGVSGIHALPDALDAYAARLLLAQSAERSLDIQYYLWNLDRTGTMLFDALRAAADRGVRVRLLLDDNRTQGLDDVLAALDAHPNIEVRLYNPFVQRSWRVFGWLSDFRRLNRRMHNKSFTADNQATIVGGRNVGDGYFAAAPDGALMYTDLDVLAIGPVVSEVSADFDRYWASQSAYPVSLLLPEAEAGTLERLAQAAAEQAIGPHAVDWLGELGRREFSQRFFAGELDFEWAPTRMVSDDPAKGIGSAPVEALLPEQLRAAVGVPERELDLISPYFVPTAAGVEVFEGMVERGVRVRILVNSLESTDVEIVHSGYAKRRRPLLEAGITLYETRGSDAREEELTTGSVGSSASSLHAKTFAVDRSRIYVGSFNFDPRSANLNTELGFVIESPTLADRLETVFDQRVPEFAYQVHLDEDGDLYWTAREEGETVRYDTEPGTSFWQRFMVKLMSWLPIEGLL